MNILLVPYDGDQPLTSEINSYDLVLSENEDGNFDVLKVPQPSGFPCATTVTVWDRQGNEND